MLLSLETFGLNKVYPITQDENQEHQIWKIFHSLCASFRPTLDHPHFFSHQLYISNDESNQMSTIGLLTENLVQGGGYGGDGGGYGGGRGGGGGGYSGGGGGYGGGGYGGGRGKLHLIGLGFLCWKLNCLGFLWLVI